MSDILHSNSFVVSKPSATHKGVRKSAFMDYLGTQVENYSKWRRQRAAQALLLRASDRTLRDIGVTRREIRREAPLEDARFDLERRQIFR